jgi:hypothetical protein
LTRTQRRFLVAGPVWPISCVGRQGQIGADHVVAAHLNLLALLGSSWRLSGAGLPVIRDERFVGVIGRAYLLRALSKAKLQNYNADERAEARS